MSKKKFFNFQKRKPLPIRSDAADRKIVQKFETGIDANGVVWCRMADAKNAIEEQGKVVEELLFKIKTLEDEIKRLSTN